MFSFKNIIKIGFLGLLTALVFTYSLFKTNYIYAADAAKAVDINQANAQKTAENLNNRGSDDSLEAATTDGMSALMNLAALNIGGAFHYGYKAYGEYNNSQEFDDLQARTNKLKNSMASNGAKPLGSDTSGISGGNKPGQNTFSRLSSDFLYKGEAAGVAAEWEKRTGMRREEFLSQLASASESGLYWDDPNLMQKLEQRYQAFKSKVTNKDFLASMDKLEGMYPQAARNKLLAQAYDKYVEFKKTPPQGIGESKVAGTAAAETPAEKKAEVKISAPAEKTAQGPVIDNSREPASEKISVKDKLGAFIGVDSEKDQAFDELMQGAAAAQVLENESIFQRVSKKYRLIFAGFQKSAK